MAERCECEWNGEPKDEVWKKHICERIREVGRKAWKDGFKNTEREKEYVKMK